MAMDAAACYDRILTYLSNISERKYGLPKSACVTKSSAVFGMQRHVRTAYGDSKGSCSSMPGDLLHGECQGKTSSPLSWAMLKISLLKTLRKYNPGIKIADVTNNSIVHRVADMFVDDCDLWMALPEGSTEEQLLDAFATAAQSWEKYSLHREGYLLFISVVGGSLRGTGATIYQFFESQTLMFIESG